MSLLWPFTNEWFSKSPETRNFSRASPRSMFEMVRNANSQRNKNKEMVILKAHPDFMNQKHWRWGFNNLCFNKLPKGFNFQNHCFHPWTLIQISLLDELPVQVILAKWLLCCLWRGIWVILEVCALHKCIFISINSSGNKWQTFYLNQHGPQRGCMTLQNRSVQWWW